MNGTSLLLAIIGHLIGDYLIQNDWMALHKKDYWFHCVVHCFLWSTAVCLFAGWGLLPWLSLFLTHFAQDHANVVAWWMDLIGQHQFRTGPCAPWSIIVVDNVWHIVTIWAVWEFIS